MTKDQNSFDMLLACLWARPQPLTAALAAAAVPLVVLRILAEERILADAPGYAQCQAGSLAVAADGLVEHRSPPAWPQSRLLLILPATSNRLGYVTRFPVLGERNGGCRCVFHVDYDR